MSSLAQLLMGSSIVVAGILSAVLGSSLIFPITGQTVSTAVGASIFQRKCSGCHAVLKNDSKLGPNLSNIGSIAGRRMDGINATTYLLESILEPNKFQASDGMMPANLVDDLSHYEIIALVGYLQNLGGNANFTELLKLDIDSYRNQDSPSTSISVDIAQVERGRDLFYVRYQCGTCHQVEPFPGQIDRAPNLAGIGYQTDEYLTNAIRNSSANIHPDYVQYKFLLDDGLQMTGKIINDTQDEYTVLLDKTDGGYLMESIDKNEILEQRADDKSTMPSWPLETMSNSQLEDLLAFLHTLR